jgi:cholesterol transport system auxiliary component
MRPASALPPPLACVGRAVGALAFIAFAAALASCSLTRPTPVKRTFLLEPASPPMASVQKLVALRVGVVNVAAPYRGKAFVYRYNELKFEADYYNEFFVAPAAMLSETTARALASANVFRRTIPPGAGDAGDYVLDGFASELYGDVRDAAKPVAALAITFYLSPADAMTPAVIWSREYRQRAPMADATPEALAQAWNAALSTILADLARDLAAAELSKP